MGFNKSYVSKEILEIKLQELNQLLKSDALIVKDEWSNKFIEGYQQLIKNLSDIKCSTI